jgi:hypothetical protein
MKKTSFLIIVLVVVSLCLSACVPLNPTPMSQAVSEAMIQTAVASTLAAERALAAGAELSYTATPDSGTPQPEETGESEEGEETSGGEGDEEDGNPVPTPENPWMLQSWCADHVGCVKFDINNRTDSWLQAEFKESDTGVTGFFSIRSKTTSGITLIPGQYQVKYTYWCDGEAYSETRIEALGAEIAYFKCPQGYYQTVDKQ